MRHLHVCCQRSKRAGSFLVGKGWLGLLLVLLWPAPMRAQGILDDVNQVFNQRLETTCRYQEAVLPAGVGRAKRYLQLGKRRYLLESLVATKQSVTKENYWLQVRGKDTMQLSKSRQELSTGIPYREGRLRQALFHNYFSPMLVDYPSARLGDTSRVSIEQAFNPVAVLALRPATARMGQTVYIINQLPTFRGDTLACYTLTRAQTGDSGAVVLSERAMQTSRQWHHNARVTCVWEADQTKREVTATRFFEGSPGSSHWVRTYATAALTNFTEIQFNSWPSGHALQRTVYTYRRQFRRLSAQRSRDTYTVLSTALEKEGTARPTFTITSIYQP